MRVAVTALIAAAGLGLGLAGCAPTGANKGAMGLAAPPPAKPAEVGVRIVDRSAAGTRLTRARVSTKSGEILILEPDGSTSQVALDSPQGRDVFEVTEDELAALADNLGLNLSPADIANFRVVAPQLRRMPTAQERALEEFAARTRPALPEFPAGFTADPEDFIAVRVDRLQPGANQRTSGDELVEVTANLKAGVDADVAFAYATCALAGWANGNGKGYGRHIRTVQNKRNGKLLLGAVFTLSDTQPMGLRVMETDDTLRKCKDRGIPAA